MLIRNCKKFISIALVMLLVSGCGAAQMEITSGSESDLASGDEPVEELVDPIVGTPAYDEADYRTLYDVEVYSALLNPAVNEYTYETDQSFGSYGKMPGDAVGVGDVLIYGNTESVDEQVENMRESMADSELAYGEKYADLQQDLTQAKKKELETGTTRNAFGENPPMYVEEAAKRATLARERIDQEIKELVANRKLEQDHENSLLALLNEKIEDVVITSEDNGVVVAAGEYQIGQSIAQGTKVIATANTSVRQFQTEFVDQNTLLKAQDIYVIVDGKRFDAEPIIVDSKEYQRLQKQNGSVYSTFLVSGLEDYEFGTYGTVVIEKDVRKDVLCVPTDAIKKDGADYYVYLYVDGVSTKNPVKIGMRDGMYTEILSGLNAGDKVLSDKKASGNKTQKLVTGKVEGTFEQTGYLYAPTMEWIRNPAKQGTSYLKEMCVADYEQVEEGQVIARIEVQTDTVEVGRLNRLIQRENERLAFLEEEKSKDYTGTINLSRDREIRSRKKNIANYQKKINELSQYSGIVELKSPYTGMVVFRSEIKAGDLIQYKQNLVLLCNYSQGYITVEDKDGQLGYGNKVTIEYTASDAKKYTIEGTVVTANKTALSSALVTGNALIALDQETMKQITTAGSGKTDSGWYRTRFKVTTPIRSVDNVVLVPKSAVIESQKSTYVKVKTDSGVKYVSFVAGGSDLANYWVIDGLSEGMEICLD